MPARSISGHLHGFGQILAVLEKLDGQILHREPGQGSILLQGTQRLEAVFPGLCLFNGLKRSLVFFLVKLAAFPFVVDFSLIFLYFLFAIAVPGLTVLIN